MNSRIVEENGNLKISFDGKILEPLAFKSFRPTKRNISDFYKAGVRVFDVLCSGLTSSLGVPYTTFGDSWIDDEVYDFVPVDKQIELFIQNAPEAYFAIMIQLDTREWFVKKHPEYKSTFWYLSQVASGELWRQLAVKYMRTMINHIEEKYGNKVFGYFLLCGTTTEWFSGCDFEESYPIKLEAYRKYLGDDKAEIPSKEQRELPSDRVFLDPIKDKKLIDYRKFHSHLITDTLLYFSAKAQETLKHNKLLGVYYGYFFELVVPSARLWNAGHIDFERAMLSDDIDMISSPSSYYYRGVDSTSSLMITCDTLRKHNKIYFLEFDHITHLAPQKIENCVIPGYQNKYKCESDTIDVMRRDFLLTCAKGCGLWWFDMFEGWFYSDNMMAEISRMNEIAGQIAKIKVADVAEIAVFAEGYPLYYVNKNAEIGPEFLSDQRLGWALAGAPIDVFCIDDLLSVDVSRYKLIIFQESFRFDKKYLPKLNQLKKAGKTILWTYAPGYIGERLCVDNMTELTDISFGTTVADTNEVVYNGVTYGAKIHRDFSPYVNDDNAEKLGFYVGMDKCAVAVKRVNGYIAAYSVSGNIPSELIRMLAKLSEVHIYSDTDDASVYINSSVIGVYHRLKKDAVVNLVADGSYKEMFSGKTYCSENKNLFVSYDGVAAKLFVKL